MADHLRLRIVYPASKSKQIGDGLMVFGFVHPDGANIDKQLYELDGSTVVAVTKWSPAKPKGYDWGFQATGINAGTPRHMILKITATAGGNTLIEKLIVYCGATPASDKKGYPIPSLTISYPSDGAMLTGTFVAYGLVSPSCPPCSISAYLVANAGNPSGVRIIPGTPTTPPDGMDWAFQFNGVTNGSWTLVVQVNCPDGSSTMQTVGVTIAN
jgi:hypothetical protein